jgi:hypothetical protein
MKLVKESLDSDEKFKGLAKASEAFGQFEIIDYRKDPEWGYDSVYLMLIKFEDGEYGLCIYDTQKEEFIEEPSDLEDYGTSLEKLKAKYGFRLPGEDEY